MRRLVTVVALLAAALAIAPTVGAITYGTVDGNGHPNVGGLVSPTQYSDGTWIYCSGTLTSPIVFLTAAHCGDEGEHLTVTFDTAYVAGDKTYTGTFHADLFYNKAQSDTHDIAVVAVDKTIRAIAPASLPAAGSMSDLPSTQKFTSVGYGAYLVTKPARRPPVPL